MTFNRVLKFGFKKKKQKLINTNTVVYENDLH
jgi:hypothetical protein